MEMLASEHKKERLGFTIGTSGPIVWSENPTGRPNAFLKVDIALKFKESLFAG